MAVGRLGEGLDMASRHGDPHDRAVYDYHGERIGVGAYMPDTHRVDPHMVERHDREQHHRAVTGIDHGRYFEPAHTAEHGPIHQELTREDREHMHSRTHDAEAMDPHHVFHSAEQLPQMAPHAFDDRQRHAEVEQMAMYHYQG